MRFERLGRVTVAEKIDRLHLGPPDPSAPYAIGDISIANQIVCFDPNAPDGLLAGPHREQHRLFPFALLATGE
jgi:hypothetical protein